MFRLFRHLAPFKVSITLILAFTFLQSLTDLTLPTLMAEIVDKGVTHGDTGVIVRVGGIMLLVALAGLTCAVLTTWLSARVGMGFGRDLRGKVFSRVEAFSLHEFDHFGTATLITRTTNDITQVQTFALMGLRMMISAPLLCIGGILMAVRLDASLSLVLVGVLPLLIGAIGLIAGRGIGVFRRVQAKVDKLALVLRESLGGVRVVRAFNRTDADQKRFEEANTDLTALTLRAQRIMAAMMPTMMLLMNFATIAILWFGSIRLDSASGAGLGIGGLMAFLQYAIQIMFSLMMMSMMLFQYPRSAVSAGRINEVLDTDPEIKDPETPQIPKVVQGVVEFRDVVFRYPGAEEPALEGISFRAQPGEVTAIIGGTGSGKSTLMSLVPRFYDVESGSVEVDGVDVRAWTQESLRRRIGFVPQKAVLFSDTVSGNLRYGKSDADDEAVRQAAAIAQAGDFVDALPEGYAAPVTRGGSNLSGGQKQRLSIARALVRRPDIYVFDDSFSALDFKTDAALRAALKAVTAQATVLLVAQRVNTVIDADRIIVLEDGKVAGMGTHASLLKDCPVYQEIVASQMEVTA